MKTKEMPPFPRSLTLRPPDMQPDLPTAFRRWVDAGELPPSAILCVFVGGSPWRKENYRNLETGALVDAEEMETLSYLNVAKESPKKQYMIFALPVDPAKRGK